MSILDNIFFAFWFFLPAGLANLVPIFASRMPMIKNWNFPMDFYFTFRGRRILGENKTIRGLLAGLIISILAVWAQKIIYGQWDYIQNISLIDYSLVNTVVFGFLLGLGALGGDAAESFFKRQMDIPSGDTWLFFDQLDYIFGVIILTYFYAPLTRELYIYLILVWFTIHVLTNFIGYVLGLKEKPI